MTRIMPDSLFQEISEHRNNFGGRTLNFFKSVRIPHSDAMNFAFKMQNVLSLIPMKIPALVFQGSVLVVLALS